MPSMAPISDPSHLLHPLASSLQLEVSASQLDGVPKQLESAVRFETVRLLQVAGILLRLPQEIIAHAIVLLDRFWSGSEGGSQLEYDSKHVAAAALYLAAKPSSHPVDPRRLLTSIEFVASLGPTQITRSDIDGATDSKWRLSAAQYESARNTLFEIETHILRVLGFQTHVALPHTLCINYLQTLDVFQSQSGPLVAKTAFKHLNTALLSPQLLYITHQPSALATAAIYLAARDCSIKLPETEWWEVFDVEREELGFLVVALRSVDSYASAEKRRWGQRKVPRSVQELQAEVERFQMLQAGE